MRKISEFNCGEFCTLTLVVAEASSRTTKAGKPYLAVKLFDGTEYINGNYWDWKSGKVPTMNDIVDVQCQMTEWQGTKQLKINSMSLNTEVDLSAFAPQGPKDPAELLREADELLDSVKDETLRTVACGLLHELRGLWCTVPGALKIHHAYTGGTLTHSLNVARIAVAIAEHIPYANRDLCLVGGLLHDLGKLFTYRLDGVVPAMTHEGRLFEHAFIGAECLGNYAENHELNVKSEDEHKIDMLRHIILSHHGTLEHGAVVVPQLLEAHIVHHADDIDAKAEQLRAASDSLNSQPHHKYSVWTDRVFGLGNTSHVSYHFTEALFDNGEEA